MTRTEKIERIKKFRPGLYAQLKKEVPSLVDSPDSATLYDVVNYNKLIAKESKRGNNITFQKNFSF